MYTEICSRQPESLYPNGSEEIPSDDSIGICTITKAVIDKTGEPEFVYRDMQPAARKPLSERIRGGRNGEIA